MTKIEAGNVTGLLKEGSQLYIVRTTKKGKKHKINVSKWLEADIASLPAAEFNAVTVEYEMENGQIRRIRIQGKEWRKAMEMTNVQNIPASFQQKQATQENTLEVDRFHNPYNFIPALPREDVKNDLRDQAPFGHHLYHPNYWSGRIRVQLKAVTPLLIPDAACMTAKGEGKKRHNTYSVRIDARGAPYMSPTSIKGMLRTAYEAVTNSRLGVFQEHKDRLGYRSPAKSGSDVVPARITEDGKIELLPGFTEIGCHGEPVGNMPVMYAAWLPIGTTYDGSRAKPQNGEKVWAEIELWEHSVSPRGSTQWQHNFDFWKVIKLVPGTNPRPSTTSTPSLHSTLPQTVSRDYNETFSRPKTGHPHEWINGYVLINDKNMRNKHDERIFFVNDPHPQDGERVKPLNPDLEKEWKNLIKDYQTIHEKEIEQGLPGPPALRGCVWSRHITAGEIARELRPETLCYARVENSGGNLQIRKLYPVMISRDLYEVAPVKLLSESLQPASNLQQLSPADRVFGWVGENGAFKGQLRIGPVTCEGGKAAIQFLGDEGLPLAILGQPKPEQTRFYVAQSPQGEPLPGGGEKKDGYRQGQNQGLRGRKVYPHHAHLTVSQYWQDIAENSSGPFIHQGRRYYHECRRQDTDEGNRDNQNRSIKGWVKPEQTFTFDIYVNNLSAVELGALLCLLNLEPDCYHRLGGGKPLGFGSVRLDIQELDLRDGQGWESFYKFMFEETKESAHCILYKEDPAFKQCIKDYQRAVEEAYGNNQPFEKIQFIKAFLNACRGFQDRLPVHYPRIQEEPNPRGEGFEWFVKNERNSKCSLPALYEADPTFPRNP